MVFLLLSWGLALICWRSHPGRNLDDLHAVQASFKEVVPHTTGSLPPAMTSSRAGVVDAGQSNELAYAVNGPSNTLVIVDGPEARAKPPVLLEW